MKEGLLRPIRCHKTGNDESTKSLFSSCIWQHTFVGRKKKETIQKEHHSR